MFQLKIPAVSINRSRELEAKAEFKVILIKAVSLCLRAFPGGILPNHEALGTFIRANPEFFLQLKLCQSFSTSHDKRD